MFMFKFLFNNINTFILIFSLFYSCNIFASSGGSGGGGDSHLGYCNKSIIDSLKSKECIYCSSCTPYYPTLPSWDDIENDKKYKEYRAEDFTLDFDMFQNEKYLIVSNLEFISNLLEHVTCDSDKGAIRYEKTNYTKMEKRGTVTGEYCSKWVVGISKDYIKSIIESNSTSGIKTITPNVDVKIFCAKKSSITSLKYKDNNMVICNNNDKDCNKRTLTSSDINFKSSMTYSDLFICRDGNPTDNNCNVVTKYELGVGYDEFTSDRCIEWINLVCGCSGAEALHDDYDSCDSAGGEWECYDDGCAEYETYWIKYYKDETQYDNRRLNVTRYDANICQKPIFLDSVKKVNIEKIYDPNLVHQ